MARVADAPGTYRVKPVSDGWRLSGVTMSGRRVNMRFDSEGEAQNLADTLFGKKFHGETSAPVDASANFGWTSRLPELAMNAEDTQSFRQTAGIPDPATVKAPDDKPQVDPDAAKKEIEKKKRAETLGDLLGIGYAGAVVLGSRKVMEGSREGLGQPKKLANDLADEVRRALKDTFGEREIGPWTMILLLTFAIPISMWLQSRPKPKPAIEAGTSSPKSARPLSSV